MAHTRRMLPLLLVLLCAAASARTVSGRVTAEGKPLAGAKVHALYLHDGSGLFNTRSKDAVTGADGGFIVALPERPVGPAPIGTFVGTHVIVAESRGYAPSVLTVWPDGDDGYDIALAKGHDVEIVVVDRAGNFVEGARAALAPAARKRPHGRRGTALPAFRRRNQAIQAVARERYAVTTDKKGRAVIRDVTGDPFELRVHHPALGVGVKEVEPAARRVWIALLHRSYVFKGRLVREQGREPVRAGMLLQAHGELAWPVGPWVLTDEHGHFDLAMGGVSYGEATMPFLITVRPLDSAQQPAAAVVKLEARPAWGGPPEEVALQPGHVLTGRVVAAGGTRGALPAAMQFGWHSDLFKENPTWSDALTAADGSFRIVLPGPEVLIRARPAHGGLTVSSVEEPLKVSLPRHEPLVVSMTCAPTRRYPIVVRKPNGRPGSNTLVLIRQDGIAAPTGGETGPQGRLIAPGIVPDRSASVYVEGRKRAFAAYVDGVVFSRLNGTPLALELRPTRNGSVLLVDAAGKLRAGNAAVGLKGADGKGVYEVTRGFGVAGQVELKGLLPGVPYRVTASARGAAPRTVDWTIAPDDAQPILKVVFPDLAPKADPEATRKEAAGERFERAKAALAGAKRREADPVEEHLTWVIEAGGPVVIDEKAKRVRRFDRLFGLQDLTVADIAFGPERVWLATNHGLVAWVRTTQSWTRFAVGGKHITVPVTAVEVKDGVLTVRTNGGAPHRFRLKENRWF